MSARSATTDPGLGAFEHADDARPADARAHLDAELAQVIGDECRGARLLAGELGVLVDVTPPGDDLVVHRERATVDLGVE